MQLKRSTAGISLTSADMVIACRKYGYIWGVYVLPKARCQGVAEALVRACIAELRAQDCTKVVLHASPLGKSLYSKLGFVASNEMALEL